MVRAFIESGRALGGSAIRSTRMGIERFEDQTKSFPPRVLDTAQARLGHLRRWYLGRKGGRWLRGA